PEAEGADVELEAEEPDGVPEAVIGAGSQRPFAIRDFPMGVYEIGESSTAQEADDEPEAEDADDELEVEEACVEPEAEGARVAVVGAGVRVAVG
nr:hypothetical protein [Tanacetum cinerariifolium]